VDTPSFFPHSAMRESLGSTPEPSPCRSRWAGDDASCNQEDILVGSRSHQPKWNHDGAPPAPLLLLARETSEIDPESLACGHKEHASNVERSLEKDHSHSPSAFEALNTASKDGSRGGNFHGLSFAG
jgi:hypothetical protein